MTAHKKNLLKRLLFIRVDRHTPKKILKWFIATAKKPPFVGLIAFLAVFAVQPLGHIIMILMEKIPLLMVKLNLIEKSEKTHNYWYSQFYDKVPTIPEGYENFAGIDNMVYLLPFIMGVVGIAIILWGVRRNTEVAGTWAGFVGASLLWTGWVEFSIHFHARYFGVKTLCADGTYAFGCATKEFAEANPNLDVVYGTATKPEYFLMQGSVGFMLVIMLYFMLNKETRCNMFRWMHKHFRIKVGKPSRGLTRNFANNVAIETLTILWFFYVYLMFLYDPTLIGEKHWFTYFSFGFFLVWSLYLIQRLIRFKRVTTALRYAIPTAIIFYNMVEIGGRWSWYKEFWVHPFEFPIASVLVFGAVIAFAVLSILSAVNKTKQIDQD